MEGAMERFILRENIRRFRDRLKTESDAESCDILRKLLAEEEAKLRALEGQSTEPETVGKPARNELGNATRN
jgi:hypothetical protein